MSGTGAPTAGARPHAGTGGGHRGPPVSRLLLAALVASVGAAVVALLPRLAGTSWAAIGSTTAGIGVGWWTALAVVWAAGIVAHSLVLTSSMRGLSTRRALSLNLAGSALANAIPLGGPASVGLTTAMARSWGFGSVAWTAFLAVSNVWNFAARAALGFGGITVWALVDPSYPYSRVLGLGGLAGTVLVLGLLAISARHSSMGWLGWAVGRAADRVDRWRSRPDRTARERLPAWLLRVRKVGVDMVSRRWRSLTVGMFGYLVLLCLLLDLCLRALHESQTVLVVVAAVGIERMLSLVPVSPGGAGFTESGVATVLIVSGSDAAVAVSAALVYRLFTFALEIPVGGVVAAAWALTRRRGPVVWGGAA